MNTEVARQEQGANVVTHPGGNQVATMNPARMIELAIEKGAVDQLDKLLALQERWESNEARKAFVRAMNEFKRNKPEVHKNKTVDYTGNKGRTVYDHATLDNICDVFGEALSAVGISYRWSTENLDGGWIRVTCILTHEMGHSEETTLQGPPDQSGGKNAIQAIGSTTEYLRRYTLLSATGVAVKGMDDDGQGGGDGPDPRVQAASQQRQNSAPQDPNLVNEQQRKALQDAIERAGTTAERFCQAAGIPSLNQLQAHRFKGAMQNLNAKAQRRAGAQQ
ncbi:ERF family protein [uncultured Marinobacter sp.]|uniref:ERF family protein n=1 Tax=uncultured Marinobacter sp. TaxID=187379 RepID=UPI002583B495|nr:ERF family protein [uncultured Marinobacter sp.]